MSKGNKKRQQMQRRPDRLTTPNRFKPAKLQGWVQDAHYHELVEKYREGTPKEGWIDPSGTDEEWEAKLFLGWLNGRDIPVEDLCILFNRDEKTIRHWLELGRTGQLKVS
jgi:hypothetical protein